MIEKIEIDEKDNILIIAPHPDDECIGVGGILVQYPKQCTVVVCTDGRRSSGNYNPNKIVQIREREFMDEMRHLGITRFKMLNFVDGTLMNHMDSLNSEDFKEYTKIFFPHHFDGHPDHTAVYMRVVEKISAMDKKNVEFYMYEVHKQLQNVTHYMALDEILEKKMELIRFHNSQIAEKSYDEMARFGARYRALQLSLYANYVECYCRICANDVGAEVNYQLQHSEIKYQKQLEFYYVLVNWIRNIQNGQTIGCYLIKKGIRKIAIYGYAELGQLLDKELMNMMGVDVLYIMDKAKANDGNARIMYPQTGLPYVDAVVVTAISYFDDIKRDLDTLGYMQVYSLRDIVDEISSEHT